MPASSSGAAASAHPVPGTRWWDRLGIGLSVLCLVHCLALPLVLTGVAVWGTHLHMGLAVLVAPVAVLAGLPGYRVHRQRGVLVLLGVGVAVLLLAFRAEAQSAHVAGTVVGGLVLLAGHVWNGRAQQAACRYSSHNTRRG